MRIAASEVLKRGDEVVNVLGGSVHQMSPTKVYPFELGKPWRELLLNVFEGAGKDIAARLAMAMNVKTLYALRQ